MVTETGVEKREGTRSTRVEHTRSGRAYRPYVDIVEKKDELLVLADLPGVKSDGIDINFENGTLVIHGKVDPRRPEDTNYLFCEYGIGDFYRSFEVSELIDAGRISAEYADGVLTLHLPKAEAAKPHKIAVRAK